MGPQEKRFLELLDGTVINLEFHFYGDIIYIENHVGDWLLEYERETNGVLVRYSFFWFVFETEFRLSHAQIQLFLKEMFEKHLGWEVGSVGNWGRGFA